MKSSLLVAFAAIFACTCAIPASSKFSLSLKDNTNRITGGSNAARNQLPYQVSIQVKYFTDFEHFCGGSIVSPTYVVTSGYCITELPDRTTRVAAGILNLNKEDGSYSNIASTLVHPSFEGDVGPNDVALVRLESALFFYDAVQPIGLPAPNAEPVGQAIVSGWGSATNASIPNKPFILQYAEVSVLTYDECYNALIDLLGDSDPLDETSNVCTGPIFEGISICTTDIGGPLVQKETNELIGIVSWGIIPCGYAGAPSVYTKVSNFVDFIRENVPDLPDSS